MTNLRMKEKIASGECVDVMTLAEGVLRGHSDHHFVELKEAPPGGKDLAFLDHEEWVWSVGKEKATGRIFASSDSRFYQMEGWECLWLR